MPTHDPAQRYGAYLLRYWEVKSDRPGRPTTWHFSLAEAGTDERRAFPDLEALVAFLEREFGREDTGAAGAEGNHEE